MRIVVWNMSHWQKSAEDRAAAWAWLRDTGTDVALVQEAVPPDDVRSAVYRPIGDTRPWDSAIVGFTTDVSPVAEAQGVANSAPVDLLRTHPGTVAVGTIDHDGEPITLVSLYGLIDDGYADTTVHRILSDLVPLFDSTTLSRRMLLAGDLNISTQWVGSQAYYRDWELATFARIEAFGLRDCLDRFRPDGPLEGCGCADGEACRHIHTQVHTSSPRPWQNDYVFATDQLIDGGLMTSASVVDDDTVRALSSHLPLVVELGT